MNIQKIVNANCTVVQIIGRLDTTTSPELEAALEACIAKTADLVLDCAELAYISSAGLRVLLKAQKSMAAKGSMKLTNVNESIMEVFDITGFIDILTIE